MNPFRRLIPTLILLFVVVILGTIGYQLIEQWSLLDSLYMVIITLFTVGFQEVHALSPLGKLFTIVIIVSGVGVAVYAGTRLVEIIIEGEVLGYGRRRKMDKRIKDMKNHYLICGYGRTGHQVGAEFDAARVPYVVVDQKQEIEEQLGPRDIPYIVGDITSDDNLIEAGIKSARGLIAAADSDVAAVWRPTCIFWCHHGIAIYLHSVLDNEYSWHFRLLSRLCCRPDPRWRNYGCGAARAL